MTPTESACNNIGLVVESLSPRLAKDQIFKAIVTSSSVGIWMIHMYVLGKYGQMSIKQVSRELSAKPDVNNRYVLL